MDKDAVISESDMALPGAAKEQANSSSQDLRRSTLRGAMVSTVAQVLSLILRTGSMMVLARLLLKTDFGLVNMVTAFTGFLGLFREAGLSMASVQRASITSAQMSTLFWVNLAVGAILALVAVVAAPVLALFYGEPRLLWVTVALGTSFLFNGAGAQHRALLQRGMRFSALVTTDILSILCSTASGIGLAFAGAGYWSLVAMTISQPLISTLGTWVATRWIPGLPRRGTGVRTMLWFGGTVTLNNVIVYLAYNMDKVLLAWCWGAESLGVYGRAYTLINLPTENLNSTIGLVSLPAMARVQHDPARLRSYFLKGYRLFLSLVMPITLSCGLFAEDMIRVFLGPKWPEAAPVFRLLAPTIIAFALVNPLAWLMIANGQAKRSLKIAVMIAPVVLLGYALGLGYGPHGVALGFSVAMVLLVVPITAWAKHGTLITTRDILKAIVIPLLPALLGAAAAFSLRVPVSHVEPALLRLAVECSILFAVYIVLLLFVMNQKRVYADVLRQTGVWPLGRRGQK